LKHPEPDVPQSLEEFVAEMRDSRPDARTFALKLKAMVRLYPLLPTLIHVPESSSAKSDFMEPMVYARGSLANR